MSDLIGIFPYIGLFKNQIWFDITQATGKFIGSFLSIKKEYKKNIKC